MKIRFLFLVLLVIAYGNAAASADDGKRSFVVRIYDDPGMKHAVDVFRTRGYRTDEIHEKEPSKTVADYPVIFIGSDVAAVQAIAVIRMARELLPTLRYVFINEDPDMGNVIFVGASTSWVSYKALKPLAEKDFRELCAGEPSNLSFHARV